MRRKPLPPAPGPRLQQWRSDQSGRSPPQASPFSHRRLRPRVEDRAREIELTASRTPADLTPLGPAGHQGTQRILLLAAGATEHRTRPGPGGSLGSGDLPPIHIGPASLALHDVSLAF